MANDNYAIPWKPLDLTPGISMLMQAMKSRADQERADANAETQRMFAQKNLERESHRDYLDRVRLEQGEKDRKEKAIESARELFRQEGPQSPSALGLLKRHGIIAEQKMGAPTTTPAEMFTPAQAIQAQTPAAPPADPAMSGYGYTPLHLEMSRLKDNRPDPSESAGTNRIYNAKDYVNANDAGKEAFNQGNPDSSDYYNYTQPPPEVTVRPSEPPGNAVADLMPMELEPERTTPGAATGAYRFFGTGGEDMGGFDPMAERRVREEKAGRVRDAIGPLGDKVELIASLVASGDMDRQQAAALLASLRADESAKAKEAAREDQQAFTAEENQKYRNEPVSIADRNRWEEGRNR